MMKGRLPKMTVGIRLILVLAVISMAMTACGPTPAPVEVTKIVEVTKEVVKEVEVTKEVVVTPTPVPEAPATIRSVP